MNALSALFLMIIKCTYDELLLRINHPTLNNRRMHSVLTTVFKALHGFVPEYISKLFKLRNCTINLRGDNILTVPRVNTTTYVFTLLFTRAVSYRILSLTA